MRYIITVGLESKDLNPQLGHAMYQDDLWTLYLISLDLLPQMKNEGIGQHDLQVPFWFKYSAYIK